MTYLATLPSLLCGLVLCGTDIAYRRVPRAVVIVGVLMQLVVLAFLGPYAGRPWLAVVCLGYGLGAMAIQLILALSRPGSLGFGDVTAALLIGQSLGVFGLRAFVLWWLLMSVFGLIWIWLWRRCDRTAPDAPARIASGSAPFVPVMVCAGFVASLLG